MKKIFKQLFCKHEWETSSNSLSIEDFYTHKNTVVSEIHKVCKKCGKQIVMAIALFLVCTMSFGQESSYVRFTGTLDEFLQYDDYFIIAKKLNGKNIAIYDFNIIKESYSNPVLTKMKNDTVVICNDSLSHSLIGASIINNNFQYLWFGVTSQNYNYTAKFGYSDDFYNPEIYIHNNLFYIGKTKNAPGYIPYLYFNKSKNRFECKLQESGSTWDNLCTLEIYIKQAEDSSTTNIDNITVKQNTIKCIKNGKLTIQKDGKTYDILGNKIY